MNHATFVRPWVSKQPFVNPVRYRATLPRHATPPCCIHRSTKTAQRETQRVAQINSGTANGHSPKKWHGQIQKPKVAHKNGGKWQKEETSRCEANTMTLPLWGLLEFLLTKGAPFGCQAPSYQSTNLPNGKIECPQVNTGANPPKCLVWRHMGGGRRGMRPSLTLR